MLKQYNLLRGQVAGKGRTGGVMGRQRKENKKGREREKRGKVTKRKGGVVPRPKQNSGC